jgi:hypothetical protein
MGMLNDEVIGTCDNILGYIGFHIFHHHYHF